MIERERPPGPRAEVREPASATPAPALSPVLAMQRAVGNAAVTRVLQRLMIQTRPGERNRNFISIEEVMTYLGADVVLTEPERKVLLGFIGDGERRYYGPGDQAELLLEIRARVDAVQAFDIAKAVKASDALVQGDYMSGDRFGIAASLVAAEQLKQPLAIVLLHPKNKAGTAGDMKGFYQRSVKADDSTLEIVLVPVDSPQDCYRAMRPLLESQNKVHSATFGTELVKRAQSATRADFQQKLVDRWRGTDKEAAPIEAKLRTWLTDDIGMPPGKYALMWVKSGEMSAEKSHHFTNPTAWAGLIERVRKETARTPVLIGEDIGFKTEPHLGKFWDHKKFPQELKDEGRMGQLRMFMMLAKSGDYDVMSVGMRSGAMEGPALIGVPTVYLEEAGNEQAKRMEKWLVALPNFFRVIIDRPPGGPQLRAWRRETVVKLTEKVERLLAERARLVAGKTSPWARERITVIDTQVAAHDQALREFDATLRMSLFEGLRPDEQDEILQLLSITGPKLVAGHKNLLEPGTRRRATNLETDPVMPFDETGLKAEDNEALRSYYLPFADWLVTPGPRLGPANPGGARGLAQGVIDAIKDIRRFGNRDQWMWLDQALAAARAGRVHGVHAATLHPGLTSSIAAFNDRCKNQGQTAQDLYDWEQELQPRGAVTARNTPVLQLLLGALQPQPKTKSESVAKWRQVHDLRTRLSALDMDGPTAANHPAHGSRLRELARDARVEMFSSDDLPKAEVVVPKVTVPVVEEVK